MVHLSDESGLDELAWVLVYREGPFAAERLRELLKRPADATEALIARLISDGRIQRTAQGLLTARDFVVPLGAVNGWEAAVLDHVQAVVQTICQRLRADGAGNVGGSTYSFDVWGGHPLEASVKAQLAELRGKLGGLRLEVDAYNRAHGLPNEYEQVITYVGQCVIEQSKGVENDDSAT